MHAYIDVALPTGAVRKNPGPFSPAVGKPLDAANVRRAFRQALKGIDGINADEWTPCPSGASLGLSGTPGRL